MNAMIVSAQVFAGAEQDMRSVNSGEIGEQFELVIAEMAPGIEIPGPQAGGELAGGAVDRDDAARLHDFRGAQQIGEIRVIRERDGGIHAVAEACGGMQRPARHHRGTRAGDAGKVLVAEKLWRRDEGVAVGDFLVPEGRGGKCEPGGAAGLCHLRDRCGIHKGDIMRREDGGDFLGFA